MRSALLLGLGLSSIGLLACGGALPHPTYVAQPSSALLPVPLPPPPARVELVPPSPKSGAVWVDGEWVYRHGRWAWSLGSWVVPPPDARFSPWTTVRSADGTLLHAPGVWRNGKGEPISPPPPLAVGSAQAGPVVDAEGVSEAIGRTLKPGAAATPPSAATPSPAP
jgi:hypothetical protein